MPEEGKNRPEENTKNPDIEETRTSIDALLELLRTKGKMELNSIAMTLSIDPRIVENWAKVLESGNLIRINYEVGKMYLEPLNLSTDATANLSSKTDLTKFILEEDLAVERISLDKFAKNIDQLNVTIAGIEKAYQQKMPDVHKILGEIDKAYEPVEAKKRSIEKIKQDAEIQYQDVNKRISELSTKLISFSPTQTEADINEKMTKLNQILESIDDAQRVITETELNKDKFFDSMQMEIDTQVRELRGQLEKSRGNIDQNIKANGRQLNDLVKSIKEQAATARKTSKEVDNFKKEFEGAKRNLDTLNIEFADRYAKIMEGIEKDSRILNAQSKLVEASIKSIKQNMGDISTLDEQIHRWKKSMNDMAREITMTRTEILKLTNQLNILESNKSLSVEKKSKMAEDLTKEGKANKDRVQRIKNTIKETAEDIRRRAEEGTT